MFAENKLMRFVRSILFEIIQSEMEYVRDLETLGVVRGAVKIVLILRLTVAFVYL
jgi:hypothetical protein